MYYGCYLTFQIPFHLEREFSSLMQEYGRLKAIGFYNITESFVYPNIWLRYRLFTVYCTSAPTGDTAVTEGLSRSRTHLLLALPRPARNTSRCEATLNSIPPQRSRVLGSVPRSVSCRLGSWQANLWAK
jgi:hypothetical protein